MARRASGDGLRLKGTRWFGRWVDASGKKREKALSTDRRVALTMLRELRREAELGSVGLGAIVTQKSVIAPRAQEYLEFKKGRVSDSHHRSMIEGLRDVLRRLNAEVFTDITIDGALKVQRAMVREGSSHRTINKKLRILRTFLQWLVSARILQVNPLVGLPRLPESGKHARRRRHRLSAEEGARLVEAARVIDAESEKLRENRVPQCHFLEVLLGTGFRVSEACGLRWCDLAFDRGSWWLSVRAEHAKNGTARANPIAPELAESLRALRSRQGRALGRLPSEADPILASPEGLPWTAGNLRNARRWFRRVLERAGIPRRFPDGTTLDLHAVRHSYCSFLREGGVDVGVAAALMGHKTLAMTQRVYSDLERLPKVSAVSALPTFQAPQTPGAASAVGK